VANKLCNTSDYLSKLASLTHETPLVNLHCLVTFVDTIYYISTDLFEHFALLTMCDF